MTAFFEDPQDYIGHHRFFVEPIFDTTIEVTLAPVGGQRWVADTDYSPKHYAVPGFPYVTYVNGQKVTR